MTRAVENWIVRGLATAVAAIFVYPFYWMLVASFRSHSATPPEGF